MIYRLSLPNSKLYLLLVVLVLFLKLASSSTTFNQVSNYDRNKPPTNLEAAEEREEENSLAEEENEEDDKSSESNKFSWKHHQDDHSIYAERSLMSEAHVKHNFDHYEHDKDDLESLKKINFAESEWQLMFRSLDLNADGLVTPLTSKKSNLFEDILARLKPDCRRDLIHVRDSVKKHKLWALRMLDSNGKLPSGLTYGRFSSPGDYEECLSVNVDETVYKSISSKTPERHNFRGKYCLIDFRLPLPEKPKGKLLSIHEPVLDLSNSELAKQFPEIKNYSAYASVFYEIGYLHGFCLPSTCDVNDLTNSIGKTLEGLYVIVNNTIDCEVKLDKPLPLRSSQILAILFLGLLFANAFFATFVHHFMSKKAHDNLGEDDASTLNSKLKRIANKIVAKSKAYPECFSIQSNFYRLTKPDPRGLTFVHYTRIVAMALTVITHTAAMGTLQAITKPADASNSEQIFRDFIPQMLANAFTSIQIFFFMAGFMLVVSTYPSIIREKGHISFLEYATKRAIRLMPGLAATIAINFLWPLFVDGPMLSYFIKMIVIPCETNWWRTLGFISNYDHVEKMCLRHSYFSASDYQLHLIAFPLLLLLYKQPTISLIIAGLLAIAGFISQIIMILTKTILPFMMVDYIDKEAFFNVVHYIHHPVWNHMSAFFYGFIIGYLIVKQIRIDLSEKTIKRIWLILTPIGIASIFAPYFWNHYKRPIYKWQMVLYILFDRFSLLTYCAWLSYATMVLSRVKKTKKEPIKQANYLPENVVLDHEKKKEVEVSEIKDNVEDKKNVSVIDVEDPTKLKISQNPILRQRSSPNIQLLKQPEEAANLRSVASSSDLEPGKQQEENAATDSKELTKISNHSSSKQRKSRAPISNLNTLCLVLSRLTFQLYLFNMVVLWIDVNHSKYFWFFSYYFIITKATAVYICSTLFAMVFFVTLESPSLSIYIMWVKSRAEARAKQREKGTDDIKLKSKASNEIIGKKVGANSDGLCMRMDLPPISVGPSFSYIDLNPSVAAPVPPTTQAKTDDQTRM